MSKKSITLLLLVEDNLGDVRLLREMFDRQRSHNIELTHLPRGRTTLLVGGPGSGNHRHPAEHAGRHRSRLETFAA